MVIEVKGMKRGRITVPLEGVVYGPWKDYNLLFLNKRPSPLEGIADMSSKLSLEEMEFSAQKRWAGTADPTQYRKAQEQYVRDAGVQSLANESAISALDMLVDKSEELLNVSCQCYREGVYDKKFFDALNVYKDQLQKVEGFLEK